MFESTCSEVHCSINKNVKPIPDMSTIYELELEQVLESDLKKCICSYSVNTRTDESGTRTAVVLVHLKDHIDSFSTTALITRAFSFLQYDVILQFTIAQLQLNAILLQNLNLKLTNLQTPSHLIMGREIGANNVVQCKCHHQS